MAVPEGSGRLDGKVNVLCEAAHCRGFEHAAQRDLHLKGFADTRNQLGSEQRMSPHIEEIIVDAYALDSENLRPDIREQALL